MFRMIFNNSLFTLFEILLKYIIYIAVNYKSEANLSEYIAQIAI